ncbi:MAG TPA: hypothetical protein VNZ49_15280 [Bacteroidia bacterium]|jgi:hypothetical protein|nr:hypothetical protein [Bacteroidia bacterium]
MPIDFQNIFNVLVGEVEKLAQDTLKNYVNDAKSDGVAFLNSTKADLQKWVNELAAGDMTAEEFKSLVNGQKDLLEMVALRKAGETAITIDKFENSLLNLVTTTIFSLLKIA